MTNQDTIPEFGIKRENEERRDGGFAIVFYPGTQKYAVAIQDDGRMRLFSGGVDEGEETAQGILREVIEEGGLHEFAYHEIIGQAFTHYHNWLRNVNRVALATCLLVILKSDDIIPVQLEEHEKFQLTWTTAEELMNNFKTHNKDNNVDHWIYYLKKSVARAIELGYDTTTDLKNLE